MERINKSNYFTPTGVEYVESSFNNVSKIFKIDDCDVTVESHKPDTSERVEELKNFFTVKGFNKIAKNYEILLGFNIPILTAEEYLRELKDIAIMGGEINLNSLNRWSVETIEGVTIANVIVIGLHKDGIYTLINEVFINGVYDRTIEYDLEELFEAYTKQFSLEPYSSNKGAMS